MLTLIWMKVTYLKVMPYTRTMSPEVLARPFLFPRSLYIPATNYRCFFCFRGMYIPHMNTMSSPDRKTNK